MYMPIRGTIMVLIDKEMYQLWAPENEGRVLLQHKVCITVACEMCYPIWASSALMKYGFETYGQTNVA